MVLHAFVLVRNVILSIIICCKVIGRLSQIVFQKEYFRQAVMAYSTVLQHFLIYVCMSYHLFLGVFPLNFGRSAYKTSLAFSSYGFSRGL